MLCRSGDVYSTYEVASWHRAGSTVDEVGSSAYGGGAVHATAEIALMSLVLEEKGAAGCTDTHPRLRLPLSPVPPRCVVWVCCVGRQEEKAGHSLHHTWRNAEGRLDDITLLDARKLTAVEVVVVFACACR